jgi:hypothetical protein
MTIFRKFFFRMLFLKIAFHLIYSTQRYLSKKYANNKVMHFSLNYFLNKNQLSKLFLSAPRYILPELTGHVIRLLANTK